MACLNVRKASFRIFAYGDSWDPITGAVNKADIPEDIRMEFTASVERIGEIIANDKVVANILRHYAYDSKKSLQLWQIVPIMLVDIFHFSHTYISSYVARPDPEYREFQVKYGSAPTWLLKRIL